MVTAVRQAVAKQLTDVVGQVNPGLANVWNGHISKVAWCVRTARTSKKSKFSHPTFRVPYNHLTAANLLEDVSWHQRAQIFHQLSEQIGVNGTFGIVTGLEVEDRAMRVSVEPEYFKKCLLHSVMQQKTRYGFSRHESSLYSYGLGPSGHLEEIPASQMVLVEFSSPNIAKRFHAGHLRSTIIGNFVGNIHEELGHNVSRINYLGDWGTQFGLLGVGFQQYGSMEKLKDNAMQHLFDIYVRINKDVAAGNTNGENDVRQKGLNFFQRMESGDPETLSLWKMCRTYSVEEYSAVYERLGVTFDEYNGEAQYYKKSLNLVKQLIEKGILKLDSETGVGYLDLSKQAGQPLRASLLKSDGSTLYLTRDLVAAMDRFENYNFDKMFYVVENGQHKHFERLIYSLQQLGHKWADRPVSDFHLKFGRVEGMSTRTGEVVFLTDILDEARDRMVDIMKSKQTTLVHGQHEAEVVADKLGISAIIIQDLKEKRQKNYQFSWERMLSFTGDTGVFLQYTHARLCSLEKNCGVEITTDCDLSTLSEHQALRLLLHLAGFEDIVYESYIELEPHYIVQYLFKLGRLANSAFEELRVKGEPTDIAQARLLLFHCVRITMGNGLRILGIKALTEM